MKNNKMLLIGGIAVVLIACAVFMFGGGSDSQGGKTPVFGNDYEKAQAAMEAGEPEQAIELLKKFTAENPKDAKAWLLLGDAYKSIETYEMPLGDKFEAFKAFHKAYWLGDREAQRRLAWELSPIPISFTEGLNKRVGALDETEYKKLNEEFNLKAKELTDEEKDEEYNKLYRLNEIVYGNKISHRGDDWFTLLTSVQSTEDELFAMEIMTGALTLGLERGRCEYLPEDIFSFWSQNVQKQIIEKGLTENNPKALVLDAFLSMPDNITNFGEFTSAYAKIIQRLARDVEKLDNVGKAVLLSLSANDVSNTLKVPQIIQLAKEISVGPYAYANLPAQILSKIEFPKEEQDQIIEAIQDAKYNDNSKTWKDVLNKMELISWREVQPQLKQGYSAYWITRGMIFEGKYNNEIIKIFFPVRFNTLKNKWELIIGRGAIQTIDNHTNMQMLHAYLQGANELPVADDKIAPWMQETLGLVK